MHEASADSAESGPGFAVMLGAFADLGDRIDKVGPAVASSLSRTAKPVIRVIGNSVVSTINNPDVLVLPYKPAAGRVWNVRRVGLFGTDGHTVVVNALADVYAGSNEEVADFSCQFMSGAIVPSITTYGKDRIRVHSGEQVYALIYAVAAGQQLSLVCEIEEYKVQDVEAMSI